MKQNPLLSRLVSRHAQARLPRAPDQRDAHRPRAWLVVRRVDAVARRGVSARDGVCRGLVGRRVYSRRAGRPLRDDGAPQTARDARSAPAVGHVPREPVGPARQSRPAANGDGRGRRLLKTTRHRARRRLHRRRPPLRRVQTRHRGVRRGLPDGGARRRRLRPLRRRAAGRHGGRAETRQGGPRRPKPLLGLRPHRRHHGTQLPAAAPSLELLREPPRRLQGHQVSVKGAADSSEGGREVKDGVLVSERSIEGVVP
mmetsp:Transcript_18505/g.73883  ORF Transcript_18505/g.73883 Transcript_18505/m.73883 type:complete len:256 (-) Transcript_18505:102-869(-)